MVSDVKLILQPAASIDISNINKYISVELQNPTAANSFLETLEDVFKKIVVFPEMYQTVDNPFIKDKTVRKALVKSYIVFYKYEDNVIQVLRVLYSRSDYQTLLK